MRRAEFPFHAPMAPPHFQGSVSGGTSCAQRTSWMLPTKPSKLGFAVRHHRLPQKIVFLLLITSRSLQGPPDYKGFVSLHSGTSALHGAFKKPQHLCGQLQPGVSRRVLVPRLQAPRPQTLNPPSQPGLQGMWGV